METVAAALPWHVLGLQMVPSGHANNGAGDKVRLQQLAAATARTAKPRPLRCARGVPAPSDKGPHMPTGPPLCKGYGSSC